MKLILIERIHLLQVLPKEGDFTTLKVLRELQENVGFSEEDHKKFKIENKDGRILWDSEAGAEEVEIELGDKAKEIVKEALLKMDKEKKLTPEIYTLYEKFVQDKEEKEEKNA